MQRNLNDVLQPYRRRMTMYRYLGADDPLVAIAVVGVMITGVLDWLDVNFLYAVVCGFGGSIWLQLVRDSAMTAIGRQVVADELLGSIAECDVANREAVATLAAKLHECGKVTLRDLEEFAYLEEARRAEETRRADVAEALEKPGAVGLIKKAQVEHA